MRSITYRASDRNTVNCLINCFW